MRCSVFYIILGCLFISFKSYGQYKDLKRELGIEHVHVHPALMGGGIVVLDYDNDGWEDIYLTGGLTPDKLLRNEGNFQFEDVSNLLPHFPRDVESSGAVAGDFDNNGFVDLFITTFDNKRPNLLLMNNEGVFRDVSVRAGIVEASQSIGGTLIDFNQDGFLDIYVNNYIDTLRFLRDSITNSINGYDHVGAKNFLYLNNQDGSFTEVAAELGVSGNGCTLASLGFVNNGEFYIYVANDYGAWVYSNEYFEYDPDEGKFIEKAGDLGLAAEVYGMGIALGDIGNDLDLDYYITNIGSNVFYENRFDRYYNEAPTYDIENTKAWGELNATSWGTLFLDVENDGDLDLFVANGFIPSANFLPTSPVDSNKLYTWRNGSFTDNTDFYRLGFIGVSRGVITSDLDLDGDLDILVSNVGPENSNDEDINFKIYENITETENRFLDVELIGVESNSDAFGSSIYVYPKNKNPQLAVNYSSGTHCSQGSTVVHFGLGQVEEVDSLTVQWPNGHSQILRNIPINQKIRITQSSQEFDIVGCMNTSAQNYNPDATIDSGCQLLTSSQELKKEFRSVNVYPNPAQQSLTIDVKDQRIGIKEYRVSIIDDVGRVFYEKTYKEHIDIKTMTLPSNIPNGHYVLRIIDNRGIRILAQSLHIFSK